VQDNCPSILILHNNVGRHKHTEPADILAGMYGQLYFPIYGNPEETLSIGEMRSGPKKKMTSDSNTSISAVGVLQQPRRGNPDLAIYHNFHARAHLNPSLFLRLNIRQYQVNDPNNPTGWVEIKGLPPLARSCDITRRCLKMGIGSGSFVELAIELMILSHFG
jgi:hypothetical protein